MLAKISDIETEIVILQKYQDVVKTNKPDLALLRGTFLENRTLDTNEDFHLNHRDRLTIAGLFYGEFIGSPDI